MTITEPEWCTFWKHLILLYISAQSKYYFLFLVTKVIAHMQLKWNYSKSQIKLLLYDCNQKLCTETLPFLVDAKNNQFPSNCPKWDVVGWCSANCLVYCVPFGCWVRQVCRCHVQRWVSDEISEFCENNYKHRVVERESVQCSLLAAVRFVWSLIDQILIEPFAWDGPAVVFTIHGSRVCGTNVGGVV